MLFLTHILQQGGHILVETMTLLIADSSEEFRNNLINALQGNYRIQSCQTGKEALEILRNATPDLLIMDLMLPELDGLTLLQVLSDSGIRPTVLATTRLVNDYVIGATTKLGVEYLMVKPCDIRAIAKRVRDLSNQKPRPKLSAPDPKTHVSNLLISLGISTKLRGYAYLGCAVDGSQPHAVHHKGALSQRSQTVFQLAHPGGALHPQCHSACLGAAQ